MKKIGRKIIFGLLLIVLSFTTFGCEEEQISKVNLDSAYLQMVEEINVEELTEDIVIPNIDGVTITFVSDKEEVISNDGKVYRKDQDETVCLTFTLTSDLESKEYQLIVIVKKIENTGLTAKEVMEDVFLSVFENIDVNNITDDINLPTTVNGVSLSWITTNDKVLTENGEVTRGSSDVEVTLICNLSYDNQSLSKTMVVTVKKVEEIITNNEALEEALKSFVNYKNWNFAVEYNISANGESQRTYYEYQGYDCSLEYVYEGVTYLEFLVLGSDELYQYYYMEDDGSYTIYREDDENFAYVAVIDYFDLSNVVSSGFVKENNYYKASNAGEIGKLIFGDYEDEVWDYVYIYVDNNKITKITAKSNYANTYNYEYELNFSKYDEISLVIPDGGNASNYPEADSFLSIEDVLALPLVSGEATEYKYYVTGTIVSIEDEEYGDLYISNDGGETKLYIYGLYSADGNTSYKDMPDKPVVGDVVTLYGAIKNYNGVIEMISARLYSKSNGTIDSSELENALNEFINYEEWNFAVDYTITVNGETSSIYYEYERYNCSLEYLYEGVKYLEFLVLGSDNYYKYYYMNEDGSYIIVNENDADFEEVAYVDYLDLSQIAATNFIKEGNYYKAINPQTVGKLVFGDYEGDTWQNVYVYVENNKIVKITAESVYNDGLDNYTYQYELVFSKYNQIELQIPNEGETPNPNPTPSETDYVVYDFSSLTGINEELNSTTALSIVDEAGSISGLLASVEVTKVYNGNGSGGAYVNQSGFLKMGTGSVDGTLVLNFANGLTISKVEILCHDWYKKTSTYPTNSNKVSVNGSSAVLTPYNEEGTPGVLTFNLNGENYVEIASLRRIFIFSITVYFADGELAKDVMEDQEFIEGSNDKTLNDVLNEVDAVGLPSEGNYDVLVIPVQFSNTTISDEDLNNLNLAFNDKEGLTGWESVSSFYSKSSYGKLNLNFDIPEVYVSKNSSSYYKNLENGSEAILLEVMKYLEPLYDLSKYDYNSDGIIDGVYLIYSAPVDYESDTMYWAYVTWYIVENEADNQMFDGLDVYYYLFAGFDFMYEDAKENNKGFEYAGYIDGLKINAATYIHETGHMLGLDDYYDYDTSMGSNEGLGGADMMDYTMGDHNSYSKAILGWVTPQVITETTTVTIESFEKTGDCLMILLDSDGSYFSEYLIIEFYTNTGLNEFHSSIDGTLLYDGAEIGVRIFHVSSSVNNPFSDQNYPTVTDNNNTSTNDELIKLVEADGEYNFNRTEGYASYGDLWQGGYRFSEVFPDYCRNDGKLINFDIIIQDANINNATIEIIFN